MKRKMPETKECKGARVVTSEQRTSGSQILHSKTRRVELNGTGIVNCKPTNRKKVMDHRGCNKNVRKTKRAMSAGGTHGCDRKTRPICDHNGRRKRGGRRANGREYTRVGSGVVSGSRVSDPLYPDRRCQSRGAEVGQSRRIPTGRPGRGTGRCRPRGR